jgi:hypothetical protein
MMDLTDGRANMLQFIDLVYPNPFSQPSSGSPYFEVQRMINQLLPPNFDADKQVVAGNSIPDPTAPDATKAPVPSIAPGYTPRPVASRPIPPPPPRAPDDTKAPGIEIPPGPPPPQQNVSTIRDAVIGEAVQLFYFLERINVFDAKLNFINDINTNRVRLDQYRAIDTKADEFLDETAQLSSAANRLENYVNNKIEAAVNQIGNRDHFTMVSTGIFGAAVVIVIVALFALAFRDRENKFLVNPDIGLQFVTLFSIIIAIILFGVLKILEGRELAALVGGIAGYILGRGTLGRKDAEVPVGVTSAARRPLRP